jgi:predicted GNAT family N-acyltransferase
MGITHLLMHARLSAVGFYQKLGYEKVGGSFTEVGIPHVRMEKYIHLSAVNDADKILR